MLSATYQIGHVHPIITQVSANPKEVSRIAIKSKIVTKTYILQTNRAAFNQNQVNPVCLLCGKAEETLDHFLLICENLSHKRDSMLKELINTCADIFKVTQKRINLNLLQVIVDPYYYTSLKDEDMVWKISKELEPQCRRLCFVLHCERYRHLQALNVQKKNKTKRRK